MQAWRSAIGPLVAGLSVLFAPTHARAQDAELDVERFKPAVTHDGFIQTEGSAVRPEDDRWELGANLNYALNPLVIADSGGSLRSSVVGGRLGLDLIGSVTVVGPFAIGLDVPVFFVQTGDADPDFAGIGDLRLVPKIRILDDRDVIGLALLAELRLPTHVGDFSGGARNVVFAPKLAVDHRFVPSGFRLGGNFGATIREGTTFANVEGASELSYAAALGYRFGGWEGPVELGGEAVGGIGLAESDKEELPLEGLLYVKIYPDEEWEISMGPGIGMIPGYGIPTFRAFAGIRYRPTSHDRDGDGIPDDEDQCPDEAEDRDGDRDLDGCPEEDADDDQDGVPNGEDDCPDAKETINGVDDDDGCPDSGDPRVVYEDGKFQILDSVHFETGSAEIKPESYGLLDQVALTMKANPDVKRIRIEGHTDSTGSRELNMRLSQQRAESVRRYLVNKGVAGNRLRAKGFGPDQPLESGDSDSDMAENRRVEFVVEDE